MISNFSIENDINFKPFLPAAGMAEWISHSNSGRRVVGSKPAADSRRRKGESEERGVEEGGDGELESEEKESRRKWSRKSRVGVENFA